MSGGLLIPTEALIAGGFYTFAILAVAGALGLVLAPRVFHSALLLVLTLGSVAAIFVILGADFLGSAQILVYVGAIMVLIMFGIMLTPRQVELPDVGHRGQGIAGALIAGAVCILSLVTLLTTRWPRSVASPMDRPSTEVIAQGLFTTYAFPFEVASLLLVVAMIGAIVVAREE